MIKFFEKNGYAIVKPDPKILNKIRQKVFNILIKNLKLKKIKTDTNNVEKFFNNFHKFINKKDLNETRFQTYHKLNKDIQFQNLYYEAAKPFLFNLVGNELAMQKLINLSIQIPKDPDSLLDMHSDAYAGESPFQVVVWMPLVNVSNTKSMFFTKPSVNKKINKEILTKNKNTIKQLYKKNKKNFWFLKLNYGEILIFSPLILHGNIVNETKESRFSLNCRFKSLLAPYDVLKKSHRNIPNFYRPLEVKSLTKLGFNYVKNFEDKV